MLTLTNIDAMNARFSMAKNARDIGVSMERLSTGSRVNSAGESKLDQLKVHDLRHTFGERLREQGINMDTCGDLLGHTGRGVTAHYCRAKSSELVNAVKTLERYQVPQKSRTSDVITMVSYRRSL